MLVLVIGLVIFLGVHSARIPGEAWRSTRIAQWGAPRWKLLYSVLSLVGFVLIVWGYGLSRANPVFLYEPATWTRHLASLLVLPAFILLAAAYVPGTRIKARVHHPMVLGVKFWAIAHLLSNGRLGEVLLFGAFLVWAVLLFSASRRRDRMAGTVYPSGTLGRDVLAIVLGTALWYAFARVLHVWLIGVPVFG